MKNKENSVVMWGHLQYIEQMKVIDLMCDLIENEKNETMKLALTAALNELENCLNTPADEELIDENGKSITKTWIH